MYYRIGETLETLTALDELEVPLKEPNFEFQDYADEIVLGTTGTRGVGFPVARWGFALMDSVEQRNQLQEFCPGKSAAVYITTQKNDGSFADFSALMHWPLKERKENNWDMDIVIEFTGLVEITGS